MARHAPGPKPGTLVEFVPESFNNREDPEPITVTIRAPSWGDQREVTLDPRNPAGWPEEERLARVREADAWIDVLLERFVVSVKNYSSRDVEIVDGKTLAESAEPQIRGEVYLHIIGLLYLEADEVKPSAGPSSSSPQTIRPVDGTAASASAPVSPPSATATVPTATRPSPTSPSAEASA